MGATSFTASVVFNIDVATPIMNYSVYCANASYTHTLYLSSTTDSSTAFMTIQTNKTFSVGDSDNSYTFTAAQLQTLYDYTKNSKNTNFVLHVITYDGGTSLGDYYTGGIIRTSADRSSPVIDDLLIEEYNYDVYAITQGQYFVQTKSGVQVVPQHSGQGGAGGQYGATIVSYKLTIGSQSVTSANPVLIIDPLNNVANQATVTATDSRGYTTTYSKNILVLEYAVPTLTDYSITRKYNSGITFITLQGTFSPLVFNGVAQNTIGSLQFQYREQGTSTWRNGMTIPLTETLTGIFSFDDPSHSFVLNEMVTYDVRFVGSDIFSDINFGVFELHRSGATVSYREGCIGINNRTPDCALDAGGDIKASGNITAGGTITATGDVSANGHRVMSFVQTLNSTTDLNDLTDFGIWLQTNVSAATTAHHYPQQGAVGWLEVFAVNGNVLQRYTDLYGLTIYYRVYTGNAWSPAWRKVDTITVT